MGYEIFIARRYLRSGRFFISASTWITIIGVTLGVGTVCFVMSMHNGFESEIRSRLLGTTSHISIFSRSKELIKEYPKLVSTVEAVDGVKAASAFIYYKAAISSASSGDGVILRGVNPEQESRTSNIVSDIKFGVYSLNPVISDGDTISAMVIGSGLAQQLSVYLGEAVVLYSLKGEDLHSRTRPRVAKFIITGIFETGMYEFDAQMAYIHLKAAQDLFRTGDAVTAVHLKLNNIYDAERLKPIIDSVLGQRYDVVPWYELHRNLFTWISIEKKVLFLGFILIVIVAAFSVISTLVMLTMEKRSEIGILKTIGSTPSSIRRIFVYNGLTIGVLGVIGGWILALLLAYVQNRFHLIALPPDIYFISYLPIDTHLLDFILAGGVTIIICFAAALYPAGQAARLDVIDILRR